jgi:hypothetical protein
MTILEITNNFIGDMQMSSNRITAAEAAELAKNTSKERFLEQIYSHIRGNPGSGTITSMHFKNEVPEEVIADAVKQLTNDGYKVEVNNSTGLSFAVIVNWDI